MNVPDVKSEIGDVNLPLTFEIYQEGIYWVGRCRELDIVTSGLEQARVELSIRMIAQAQVDYAMKNGAYMNLFRKGPVIP